MPRVLHFSPFLELSGANRSMLELLRTAACHGPVGLVTLASGSLADAATAAGVEVFPATSSVSLPKGRLSRVSAGLLALERACRRFRPDVIHSNSAIGNHYAKWAQLLHRLPLVTHQRDNYVADYFHSDLHKADRIIAITEWVASQLPDELESRTRVLLNPVTLPATNWHKAGQIQKASPLRIGFAGRCVPNKGLDLLLDAAEPLLRDEIVQITAWGIDESPFGRSLRSRMLALGNSTSIEPFRNDIENLFKSVDVIVVPSRYPEPMGRMAIEAMAGGLPVIVADHGGLPEVVKHKQTGLLHEPNNPVSLRAAIMNLASRLDHGITMGTSARIWVGNSLDPGRYFTEIEKVYHDLAPGK